MLLPCIITYNNPKTLKTYTHLIDFISLTGSGLTIGSKNGYGWYVIDIQILYKDRFYSIKEYDIMLEKETKKKNNIFKQILSSYKD